MTRSIAYMTNPVVGLCYKVTITIIQAVTFITVSKKLGVLIYLWGQDCSRLPYKLDFIDSEHQVMGDKPLWEQIGSQFVQLYYQHFDNDRVKVGDLYYDDCFMTFEGSTLRGKNNVMAKLSSLPFQAIQHIITAQDHQPTPDSCVMSMVMGQLKADQDQVMGFQQVFLLRNFDNKWLCTNEMFRLSLHNFA
ncbi:nuclear transport factor 2, like isoform X3 [Alosa alosa]|uniref:nuclear transport factor 2, like isoform X3 n=1 Tax=Alosa alosa TaxID=278164 RepID=UPI0020153654|nr:nuclear transport factor 2, like isoform X3 [Alosa alosa]